MANQSHKPPEQSLSDFLHHEVYPRLTAEQVYDWPGHNWQKSGQKWRGACPWHESKSGTSFDVSTDSLLWYCAGCGVGGGPLEYRWKRQDGRGDPGGENFVRLARELAELAGIPFPERELSPEETKEAQERAALAVTEQNDPNGTERGRGSVDRGSGKWYLTLSPARTIPNLFRSGDLTSENFTEVNGEGVNSTPSGDPVCMAILHFGRVGLAEFGQRSCANSCFMVSKMLDCTPVWVYYRLC